MNHDSISRRSFVKSAVGAAAAAGMSGSLFSGAVNAQTSTTAPSKMPTREFGKTGHKVALFSLGGQGLLEKPGNDEKAIEIINRAIDLGVNYIDTANYYGAGSSEKYIGQVLKTRRKEVYLATKTGDRTYDGAMRHLELSLQRLQTDHLDTWQLHNVRTQADLDRIFSDTGAIKALEKARDQKIVRNLGITGHRDPFILKQAIDRYPFDTILLALNAADKNLSGQANESSFVNNILPVAVEKKMGIIAMKIVAAGRIFKPGGITKMEQAMGYVLSLPVSTVIVGITEVAQVEENVRVATNFKPLTRDELVQLEQMTSPYLADATFFKRERGY